jgi:hypothetical protein
MRRSFVSILALFLFAMPVWSADSICGVPFKSPMQVEAAVKKARGVVSLPVNDFIHGYTNEQSSVFWVFTSKKSAAHPAVVCRWQKIEGKKPVMLTDIRCGGPKTACDKLAAEYRGLDRRFNSDITRLEKLFKPKK